MRERRFDWPTRLLAALAMAVGCLGVVVAAWLLGGVSRVKVRTPSPDGQVEAVCRAWLPESTEYGVWLRRSWQPFGTYLAHTGTESMGRCRDIAWSPDGTLVVVVNEGNAIVILDVATRRRLAVHGRLAPGETWDYASARIITSVRFTSDEALEFVHCDRRRPPRGSGGDFSRCGQDVRRDRARLTRTAAGVSVTVMRGARPG
jgi:hypothetical protein